MNVKETTCPIYTAALLARAGSAAVSTTFEDSRVPGLRVKTLDQTTTVKCTGSSCEWWTRSYTTESPYQESGCAFRLNAMKNADGKIPV